MAISNPAPDSANLTEDRDRKRKRSQTLSNPSSSRWKNENEQKLYSSRLLEALRRVRRSNPTAEVPPRSRLVREAADRALAIAARGRTRWSRAILANRTLKLKSRGPNRAGPVPVPVRSRTSNIASSFSLKKPPVLQRKTRLLGRLVPGCRKLELPTLLEETIDYIPALEMQARVMTQLVQILSGLGADRSGSP